MRLHRLSLVGEFKLLSGTSQKPLEIDFSRAAVALSPVCLVGLNGSGKSSLMELIADIFGYADRRTNSSFQVASDLPYSATLEYSLTNGVATTEIRLACTREHVVAWKRQEEKWEEVNASECLPRVFAYSSGGNQALSTIFARAQHAYLDVISRQGRFVRNYQTLYSRISGRDTQADERTADTVRSFLRDQYRKFPNLFADPASYNPGLDADEGLATQSPSLPRGVFSTHDASQFTFIAAWLLGVATFKSFLQDRIGVTRLLSFELELRLHGFADVDWVEESVDQLVQLASRDHRYDPTKMQGVLEFTIDNSFQERFDQIFQTARERFFDLLQFFFLLAGKRWSKDEVAVLNSARYIRNIPIPAAGYAPLRLRNVSIELSSGVVTLYDRLSDGEHQLVQIAGALTLFGGQDTLFILDEPESHLNPVWRAEFVQIMSEMLLGVQSRADVLISTHSPFVVSGCRRRDVMKFSKQQGVIAIERPAEETYGSSFDYLLSALFDMDTLLASKPAEELQAVLARANLSELEAATKVFGGSMEKAAVFTRLSEIKSQNR